MNNYEISYPCPELREKFRNMPKEYQPLCNNARYARIGLTDEEIWQIACSDCLSADRSNQWEGFTPLSPVKLREVIEKRYLSLRIAIEKEK